MANVEPLKALNLEPSQQLAFIRYYRTLPEKSKTTIRFFNRGEYFTVHEEDAKLAVDEIFKGAGVIKTMGVDNTKLNYLCLSKTNFEKLVRELLLVRQYRCEVYVNQGSNRNNDWVLEYKGSPGNLSQFEEVLFENNDAIMNSTVMAVKVKNNNVGICTVSVDEHLFTICEFSDNEFFSNLESLVVQIGPRECLVETSGAKDEESHKIEAILKRSSILCTLQKRTETKREDLVQDLDRLLNFEEGEFKNSLSLPEIEKTLAMSSLHILIKYLELTSDETHFNAFKIKLFDTKKYVHLDSAAMNALNIIPKTSQEPKHTNLLGIIDNCRTPQGHRLLAQWIKQPLRDINTLNERLDIVEVFVNDTSLRQMLYNDHLRRIPDLLMLAKKLIKRKAGLQDCYKIYQTIDKLPYVVATLRSQNNKSLNSVLVIPLSEFLEDMQKFLQMMETTLDMDYVDKGEFLVKPSYSSDLQDLHKRKEEIEEEVQSLLRSAARDLGLETGKTIKLDFNDQHSYFFRVTLKEEPALRDNKKYTIIDAVKGGVRFSTGKLDRLNTDYNDVTKTYQENQKSVVEEILNIAAGYANTLTNLNQLIAQLDVLVAFSQTSASAPKPYVRPKLHPEGYGYMKLTQVRHPILEIQDGISYNPNDVEFKNGEYNLHIITGPNMGGKSTYIRSIGVTCLLAQIGCFVPCDEAELSLFDSIMARVGSEDCEQKGMSTFMVEMVEISSILRTATKNSLIMVDELGRGTSTYEGCGIAWAIAEYLAKEINCFTLYATHFHEVTRLALDIPTVTNKHVAALVDTENHKLTLLYQVKPGICDQSFGIHVAKMVGFSEDFCSFARSVQEELEDYKHSSVLQSLDPVARQKVVLEGNQNILTALKKIKELKKNGASIEDIKKEITRMKEELSQIDNPYVKSLLETSEKMEVQ